ncbi:MAG: formyltransferase family protein, partial [Gemmatimonadales bacterium]
MRVAVFASGGGTNLQALLDRCRPPEEARVGLVVSDKASAGALERARSVGVETEVVADPSDGAAIVDLLARAQTDLIVLAGYLKLMPLDVVRAFDGRLINIHPALLPAFGGKG